MKRTNKILLLVVLLALTLILVSCRKPKEDPLFTIVNLNTENLVVDELDTNKKLEGTRFFVLRQSNALAEETALEADDVFFLFDDGSRTNLSELDDSGLSVNDAYAKEYIYNISLTDFNYQFSTTITQYKEGSGNSNYSTYVNYLTFDDKNAVTANGGLLTDSYIFEANKLSFYKVSGAGVELIDNDDLTFTGFPEGDDLIKDRKYVNNETFDLVAENEDGLEFNFKVRLAATDSPLNVKTATFWNWIFLQVPIAYLMALLSGLFSNSFAVGIVLTTIIVRTVAWPIYAKTNDMSLKMSVAQPDMQRLEKKYANRKDPESQQRKQMEMMQIYKKHNISMLGCFLPILQMPIFFAMYQVVRRITIPGGQFYQSVANTKFLGTDLSAGGTVSKIVFTALVGITMFALQKISQLKPSYAKKLPQQQTNTQSAQTEQTMKTVSIMMIFMMIFTAYITPGNALSFYWIIGNFYSIGQTLLNRKLNEVKYEKLQEEKLYGRSREIVEAQEVKEKGGK